MVLSQRGKPQETTAVCSKWGLETSPCREESSTHLEHGVNQGRAAHSSPNPEVQGWWSPSGMGSISSSKSHIKVLRLWTWSVLSLGDPVKHHLLQENIRQKSMCSHRMTFTFVWASHHPLPCLVSCHMKSLCFQGIGHSLIHSSSQQESLLWLLSSICFIYCFDKNTVCSQSGSPSMPWEPGEGRDHQPVPYAHPSLLPKGPSHDTLYPWETSLTQQYPRQCMSSLTYAVGFMFFTTRKSSVTDRLHARLHTDSFNTVIEALLVAQRGLFQTPRVTLCVAEIPMCGLGIKPLSEVFHFCFPLQLLYKGRVCVPTSSIWCSSGCTGHQQFLNQGSLSLLWHSESLGLKLHLPQPGQPCWACSL